MRLSIFCYFIPLFFSLLLQPTVSSASTTSNGFFTKKHIRVAFIMQKWDHMDKLIRVFVIPFYNLRFRETEKKFNVKCDICFLWNSWKRRRRTEWETEETECRRSYWPWRGWSMAYTS